MVRIATPVIVSEATCLREAASAKAGAISIRGDMEIAASLRSSQ